MNLSRWKRQAPLRTFRWRSWLYQSIHAHVESVQACLAEVGSIDMLANGFLIPACDPGSLNRYADRLSVHMRSIISGLGLVGRQEVIIGEAVHSDIYQSSIGEHLAWELVVVLMRFHSGTGPILAKSLRQSRNDIGIVGLSLPYTEQKDITPPRMQKRCRCWLRRFGPLLIKSYLKSKGSKQMKK